MQSAQIISLPTQKMTSELRKGIALQVISDKTSVTAIANQHGVSRKFVYQQKDLTMEAVDQAFEATSAENDDGVFQGSCRQWVKFKPLAFYSRDLNRHYQLVASFEYVQTT